MRGPIRALLPKICAVLNPYITDLRLLPMQKTKYVMNCRIMTSLNKKIIVIPARMAASRLPGKPLADIGGKPMIQHVWERAIAADIGPVHVATDDTAIADVINAAGGSAIMTRDDHPSGSDRVYEAVQTIDPDGAFDQILNLQGDLPEMPTGIPTALAAAMDYGKCELATLVTLATPEESALPQVVKAVVSWDQTHGQTQFGRAHYFSRAAIPTGTDQLWHHIGVYGWRRDALARFIALPQSPLEMSEKLEQLRAIEAGMTITVARVDDTAGGVDTPEDLDAVRRRLA